MVDPAANAAQFVFDHVAIAITDGLALEAMPAPQVDENEKEQFELPRTVQFSKWSNVELEGGVRIIPILDLAFPTLPKGGYLNVLRHGSLDQAQLTRFNVAEPEIARIIGSEYSVKTLESAAARIFGPTLTNRTSLKLKLTSVPTDTATKLGLTEEFRKQLENQLPQYAVPEAARSFFCSQLVVLLLERLGLLSNDMDPAISTPTGLYKTLFEQNWNDVTDQSYHKTAIKDAVEGSPSSCGREYYSVLSIASLASQQEVLTQHSEIHAATQNRAIEILDTLNARIQHLLIT